jgi:hypothetical protein
MGCVVGEVYALRKDTKSLTAAEWEVSHVQHTTTSSCRVFFYTARIALSFLHCTSVGVSQAARHLQQLVLALPALLLTCLTVAP